ncbi:MAG: 1,4-alpha-glucan branching protein GlgB [Oscillospiraceae bacterium]|nr:1,4-alpha-glucan branching protein GlgB [Oscillospiraceae bacterium]
MEYGLELPVYLFHQGTNARAYDFLGCHTADGRTVFRVWAPHAAQVAVLGDFNGWEEWNALPMTQISGNGIWEAITEEVPEYSAYKYQITPQQPPLPGRDNRLQKADPYAFHAETRPGTASKVYHLPEYAWADEAWIQARAKQNIFERPMNIYELHAGSWRRFPDGNFFDYAKLAAELIPYVIEMGYTHIELMPLSEYPFDGSWGYQCTGYFAATSRYGTPEGLMHFVDECHANGIGVLMDWVPAHFPKDAHGLADFDGEPCYEYADYRKGEHKGWGTKVFDYGKPEVRSFLLSSAAFWLDKFHMDGLRVDAVASMLYLDYARKSGEWQPNRYGGNRNLEAEEFLRQLNQSLLTDFPGIIMAAEESTAYPMVTMPPSVGGLGFNFKWNMGWMNDTLKYIRQDPVMRSGCQNLLTFSFHYAFSENFILPISHDEVVHGKKSLIGKMPGDYAAQFAGLKLFLAHMTAHPGKKLLFMGQEFGQFIEWAYARELDWLLLDYPAHEQMRQYTKRLNHFYLNTPALWEMDTDPMGFAWLNGEDTSRSVISFLRRDKSGNELICVLNFTPVTYNDYLVPAPLGKWHTVFSATGAEETIVPIPEKPFKYGWQQSLQINLPAFGAVFFAEEKT